MCTFIIATGLVFLSSFTTSRVNRNQLRAFSEYYRRLDEVGDAFRRRPAASPRAQYPNIVLFSLLIFVDGIMNVPDETQYGVPTRNIKNMAVHVQ